MVLLSQGQFINDTYTVERFLGEGAFAEVYRVQHRFLGRQAMKVLKLPGANIEEIEDLLAEAVLLSRIGHRNIIRVYDANVLQINGACHGFFTMEYIAGGSLDRLWQSYRDTSIPVPDAVDIIKQVCSGLSVAHSENPPIVHRDIKPQNILIGYDDTGLRVRVSDFGLAKHANPLTLLVSARGTLSFKPPESLQNQDSPASDVWAIGTTLYLLLTNKLPFPELDDRHITDATKFVRPLRPASIYNIRVDPTVDAILLRCLASRPEERYHDATALLNELIRWQPGAVAEPQRTSRSCIEPDVTSNSGQCSSSDLDAAEKLIHEAFAESMHPGSLTRAADLLEEAINIAPVLREEFEPQLRLWRRGICM